MPLAEQDPALWDAPMIAEAEALLRRAGALGAIGRYQLEGALQSAHVHRCRTGQANWAEVVQLYDALFALAELAGGGDQSRPGHRRVARRRGRPRGDAGRRRRSARSPNTSPIGPRAPSCWPGPAPTARPADAYEIAIGLERDPAVRRFLQRRAAALPKSRR